MGRRLEYEVKTSVRLNMSNPQHVKINDVIQNLDPKIFKSKNQFIIDAIQFYIDNYGKETFVIKKKEKERAEYIRSEDIEDIKEEVIEVATNEARKEVIRLLGGVISGMNVGQPVIMQAANSEAQEPTEDGSKEKQHENYKDWSEYREGSFVWADMIKRDLDACILQANDFSGFLELLSEKGYEVKQGKYLAVRPQGMTRFRRCKTLGENYSQEAIVERIAKEDLSFYQSQNEEKQAAIVKCYVKRYHRAKMSGLQKRYYAKLYRIGKLKKKPYSQVWKYRDDIRKMHKLQEQYLFLVRHKIESAEELVSVLDNLTDKKKEASKEKSKTYKAKERFKDIFDKAEQIRGLNDAESCYQSGDTFFEDEHNAWERLNTELLAQGYSVEEVESLRKKYESSSPCEYDDTEAQVW